TSTGRDMKHTHSTFSLRKKEKETLEDLQKQFFAMTDNIDEISSVTTPHAFIGWTYFYSIFLILSAIVYFMSPIMSIVSVLVAVIPCFIYGITLNKKTPFLYERYQSRDIISSIPSIDYDRQEIVLLANIDAPYQKFWVATVSPAFNLSIIILSTIGAFYMLILSSISIATAGPYTLPSGSLMSAGFCAAVFVPAWLAMFFYYTINYTQQDMDGNKNSCQALLDIYKHFQQDPLQNTRITVALCGANEVGYIGLRAFLDYSKSQELQLPQLFVCVNKLLDKEKLHVTISKKTQSLSRILNQIDDLNVKNKYDIYEMVSQQGAFLTLKQKGAITISANELDKNYQHDAKKTDKVVTKACDIIKEIAVGIDDALTKLKHAQDTSATTIKNKSSQEK
ncbi:MAG: hypothetical protein RSB10_01230, partial [Clostridia bacterium]